MAGLNRKLLNEMTFDDSADAIQTAVTAFEAFVTAQTQLEKAHALVALEAGINDLKTWHPDFNIDTSQIES